MPRTRTRTRPAGGVVETIYAFAASLAALGLAAGVIGVHDASLAGGGLGGTLGSAALVAVAVVLAIAAWQLFGLTRHRTWEDGVRPACKPIVLVAFLLTILVGVYTFFSAIRNPAPQRPFVVVGAALLVLLGLGGLSFFGRDARVTLPRLGTIALGFVGTILGAWQFWYSNQYSPEHAGRAVALSVTLQLEPNRQPAYDVIRATIGYKAVGKRSVAVVGSTYTLTGSRVFRCERPAKAKAVAGVFKSLLPDPQRSRFMADVVEAQPAAVLAAGRFAGDGKRLDPDVPAARDLIFMTPRGRYQLLRFRAQLFAIPASVQLSQREPPTYEYADDRRVYGFWHVDDDSWFRDLVYGRERWVVLRYELGNVGPSPLSTPDLRVVARFPKPSWGKKMPTRASVLKLFEGVQPSDASEPFADSELALADVAEPTPSEVLKHKCR